MGISTNQISWTSFVRRESPINKWYDQVLYCMKAPEKILNILRRRRQRKIDFDFSTLEDLWLLRAADYCTVYSCRNLSRTAKTDARSGERLLRAAESC